MIKNPILGTLFGMLIVGEVMFCIVFVFGVLFKFIGVYLLLLLLLPILGHLGYEFWKDVLKDK
jgi:hypothetical protein